MRRLTVSLLVLSVWNPVGKSKADAFAGTESSERVPGGVEGLREVLRREAEMAVRGEFVRSSVSYCSPLRREAR